MPHGDISPQNADLGPVSSPLGLFVLDQPRGLRSFYADSLNKVQSNCSYEQQNQSPILLNMLYMVSRLFDGNMCPVFTLIVSVCLIKLFLHNASVDCVCVCVCPDQTCIL